MPWICHVTIFSLSCIDSFQIMIIVQLHSLILVQTVLKSAGKLVLIVTGKQYQGAVDGSIPVLIRSVSSSTRSTQVIVLCYDGTFLSNIFLLYCRSTGWKLLKKLMTCSLVMPRYSHTRQRIAMWLIWRFLCFTLSSRFCKTWTSSIIWLEIYKIILVHRFST